MARIVLADDGIEFDGTTLETRPLGGAESSVILLARELARRGHEVYVRNKCRAPLRRDGVDWAPIAPSAADWGVPANVDLYIANRGDRLIPLMPRARRAAFWVHNPARYVLKWRYLAKLWRVRPTIVFLGDYHAATYPWWGPDGGRVVIPYGIPEVFRAAAPAAGVPAPRAIFTSNPLRSLDWLIGVWRDSIRPRVPQAELHLFTGAETYGTVGETKAKEMLAVLRVARDAAGDGVVLRAPVPKSRLVDELRQSRVMLYRGDMNETFCLAVGEAQAMGVPAVVERLGSVVERVVDGETGFVAAGDEAFAAAAVRLLTDDALWRRQHAAAIDRQRHWGWPEAAASFERLMT